MPEQLNKRQYIKALLQKPVKSLTDEEVEFLNTELNHFTKPFREPTMADFEEMGRVLGEREEIRRRYSSGGIPPGGVFGASLRRQRHRRKQSHY